MDTRVEFDPSNRYNLNNHQHRIGMTLLNHKRAPAHAIANRQPPRMQTPVTSMQDGGSEPFQFRSMGDQVMSQLPTAPSARFSHAGMDVEKMRTPAEQAARRMPTCMTYRPRKEVVLPKAPSHSLGPSLRSEVLRNKANCLAGPGAYRHVSAVGKQTESHSTNNHAARFNKARTGRIPIDWEPVEEKYEKKCALPELPPLPPTP